MFRQLYLRLTGLILAVTLLAVLIAGGISIFSATQFYRNQFSDSVADLAGSDFPQTLHTILTAEQEDAERIAQLQWALESCAARLSLDENRTAFVLNARDASVVVPSALQAQTVTITPNLSAAMRAAKGEETSLFGEYLDYALFLKNGNQAQDGFIFYVRDNKAGLDSMLQELGMGILWTLLAGLILALLAGIFLAGVTMKPLQQLSKRAENFSKGNFEPSLDKLPNGEMGELVKTFNQMGMVMNHNLTQINAEKHKVEAILEHINNGIIAFDTDQNIVHINPAAKRMLQIENPQTVQFDSLFSELGAGVCMAEFLYLDRSKTEERDFLVGSNHIKAFFVPFKLDEIRTAGVVCVFEDVTEQFTLEAARQKFVAEVSHELKTPLTTIRTYTETLLNGYLDDKRTASTLLNTVQNETDKMTALVQNLLILNRFDMQRVQMEKEFFSVDEMLRGLVKVFSLEAEQRGIEISYNRTTEIPRLYADQGQIERALKNIISNSIKYSSKGDKIQIFAGSLYDNKLYIKVEDTGKGIPKADLEHVFERFYRVDKARSRDRGGTGLGLAITKEIIESHGGTIEIESEFSKFTRVTINLPTNKEE
ncbi:MAG: HAMP domain-containing protein [Clostridia bacterium]|nr:HAMP domain-containing protein [Clostridia bacterium]